MRNRKKNLRNLSTSNIYTKRLKNRAALNGAVTVDRSVAIDRIRNSSIGLNQNILKPTESNCSFVYNPSSYGEGKNYVVYPQLNNLLKYSEEFDNGAWIKNSSTANPTGSPTIYGKEYDIKESATSNQHYLFQPINVVSNEVRTATLYLKKGNVTWIQIATGGASYAGNYWFNLNLDDGTIGNRGSASNTGNTSVVIKDGYFVVTCTTTAVSSGTGQVGLIFGTNNTDASTRGITYLGDTNTTLCKIYLNQLEQGSTATAYQKTTDGIIDFNFTRATTATVTNKDGSIGDSCYNLFSSSEDFTNTTFWVKDQSTLTTNAAITPIGTTNATKLVENTANNSHLIFQGFNSVSGTTYTITMHLKAAERSKVRIVAISDVGFYVDLITGAISNISGSSTTPTNIAVALLQNGWVKVTYDFIANSAFTNVYCELSDASSYVYTGDGVSGAYIWGFMVNRKSTDLLPYLRTTNRLAVPRIDYSLDLTKPSLLIEPQKTNSVINSDPNSDTGASFFSDVTYSTYNWGIGLNNATVFTNNSVLRYRYQGTASASLTYTFSCYVIMDDGSAPSLGISGNSADASSDFHIVLGGVIAHPSTATIKNVFGNIYRVSNYVTVGTTNLTANGVIKYTGGTNKGFKASGFQLEQGSNATTYIPTTTATVTRNAETSFVDLQNNSLLNQNNFTLFVDGYLYDGSGATRSIALSDTTTGGVNDVGFFDGIKASFAESSVITSDTTSLSSNTAFKIAIQRSGTSIKFFRNGAQIWSTQTVAVVDYRYLIINNGGSSFAINKIELFKESLSDATLITKTT